MQLKQGWWKNLKPPIHIHRGWTFQWRKRHHTYACIYIFSGFFNEGQVVDLKKRIITLVKKTKKHIRYKFYSQQTLKICLERILTTFYCLNSDVYLGSQSFQSAVGQDEATPDSLKNIILSTFEPLHKFHTGFLREVEQRLALWWVSFHFQTRSKKSLQGQEHAQWWW